MPDRYAVADQAASGSSPVMIATVKVRSRKREKSISGCSRCRWRRTKKARTARPRDPVTTGRTESPAAARCLTPWIVSSRPPAEATRLRTSTRPVRDARTSRSRTGASTRKAAMTGRLTRNTEPHQNAPSSSADHRPDGEPGGERRGEYPDRPGAPPGVGEELAQHGERRRQQGRTGHTHERPAGDEDFRVRCERRGGGSDAEHGRADEQEPEAAVAVADAAEGDQQRTHGEAVDVQHPQRLVGGGRQGRGDARHRQEEDGTVHRDQQDRAEDHGEPEPGPPAAG